MIVQVFGGRCDAIADTRRQQGIERAGQTQILDSAHIAAVAGKELVAPFAGQHHLHAFARQPRDEEERDARGKRERQIAVPGQLRYRRKKIVGAYDHLVMIRVELPCNLACVLQFVVFLLREAD